MPAPARAALALAALLTLAIAAGHVAGGWGPLSDGSLTWVVAALACYSAALSARGAGRQRCARLALAGALGLFAVGNGLNAVFWPDAHASAADGIRLAGHVVLLVGLVLLARSWAVRPPVSFWLDGATLALAIMAVDAAYFVPAAIEAAHITPLAAVVQVAFPVLDLAAVLFMFILLRLGGWPPHPGVALSFAGLVVLWLANACQFWSHTNGHAELTDGASDVLRCVAWVMLGAAPWVRGGEKQQLQMTSWAVVAIPLGAQSAAVAVLVADHYSPVPEAALWLAVATTVAVMARAVLTFNDLRALNRARFEARTDELTGLANRRWFLRQTARCLDDYETEEAAILLVDLNRFKELNDALGHHAGDLMLSQLGPRLAAVMRGDDLLARLGGDEFAVLCPDTDLRGADDIAARIARALRAPFTLEGLEVHVDASIGIALFPDHASTAEELLQRADVAMYEAKAHHAPRAVYDVARDAHTRERLELIGDLRQAILDPTTGGMVLHFQPQVNLATGAVESVEALVRWDHPERGMLPPFAFLDAAVGSGLMRPLTSVVLAQAIEQLATWRSQGIALSVAVNLSATDLTDTALPDEIERLLTAFSVTPELLSLELTETDVIANPERALETLHRLRTLGCSLALDDFGTGHSSLSLLKTLPVDELKIDRSFVAGIIDHADDAAIVRAAVTLGRDLGLRVVAEGIETQELLDELRTLGATSAQGFLLSKPLPADELATWLAAWSAQPGVATQRS